MGSWFCFFESVVDSVDPEGQKEAQRAKDDFRGTGMDLLSKTQLRSL